MAEPVARPQLKLGIYQHYKGHKYRVIDLACHSETLEWHVVYQPLYEHSGLPDTWVRPYEMFIESVVVDGQARPRFKLVDDIS